MLSTKKKSFELKLYIQKIYYLLLGICAFSSLGQVIILQIFKLDFYLIEIFFIPFFICNYKKYYKIVCRLILKRKSFIFMMYLVFISMIIGIIYTFDILNIVTMYRSIFYIVLLLYIFSEDYNFSITNLQIIVCGVAIGELIRGIYFAGEMGAALNSAAIALMIIIPIVRGKNVQFFILTLFAVVVAINSGYRLSIIIVIVAVAISVLWKLIYKWNEKNLYKLIGNIGMITLIIILFNIIKNNFVMIVNKVGEVLGMSTFSIFRVTDRLIGLFSGNIQLSQDGHRLEVYKKAFTSFGDRVLPRGLVGKSIGTLPDYIDIPITYFYDLFGSILTVAVLGIVCFVGIGTFIASFKRKSNNNIIISGLMFPIYFLLFIVNGSFLYITQECILTGIIIGGWFINKSNIKFINYQKIN